jgi:hypothetical protein
MKYVVCLIALVTLVVAPTALRAAAVTVPMFGFNYEWLRDDDGDGIPNHLDDDYVPPRDGTGYQMKHGRISPVSLTTCIFPGRDLPLVSGDTTRDRIRLNDGIRDRLHLRLKDASCK